MTIDVLGTTYFIDTRRIEDDMLLGERLAYTDESVKQIVVVALTPEICELKDKDAFRRHLIRHEIIHAFLFESGMGDLMAHAEQGHDEQMIDWFARQSGKIFKAFQDANVS